MTCGDCGKLINEIAGGRIPSKTEAIAFWRHVGACPSCRARMTLMQQALHAECGGSSTQEEIRREIGYTSDDLAEQQKRDPEV
jgi:ABC-type molybdenum transport system ATPase subunit/photorepair protein PhrA